MASTLALASLVAACSDDTSGDNAAIADAVEDLTGSDSVEVDCPAPSGDDSRTCTATIEGQPLTLDVQGEGEGAEVELNAVVARRAEVEQAVTEQAAELAATTVTVACGTSDMVVIEEDESIRCRVEGADGTGGTAIVVTGPDGRPAIVDLREG